MHSLVKGIILSVRSLSIVGFGQYKASNSKRIFILFYMAMAFIWRNKHFRVVMCNWCTDYRYRNCNIVFVFRYK